MGMSNIIKKIFSFDWLKGEVGGTATGTVIGHGIGQVLTDLIGSVGKNTVEIILKNIFYIPPRAELMSFLMLHLDEKDRQFYEERLLEAKTTTNTPSENDTVTALCKILALKKKRIPLQDKDGNPILNKEGKPIYIPIGELSEKQLRELFTKYARAGRDTFWIWIDELIHNKWMQKFEVAAQKIKEGLDVFLKWLKDEVWTELKKWSKKQRMEDDNALRRFRRKIKKREREIRKNQKKRKIQFFPKIK